MQNLFKICIIIFFLGCQSNSTNPLLINARKKVESNQTEEFYFRKAWEFINNEGEGSWSAIAYLEKTIELNPFNGAYYNDIGNCYRGGIKDFKKALEYYNKAIKNGFNESYVFYNRAICKIETNDLSGACMDNEMARSKGWLDDYYKIEYKGKCASLSKQNDNESIPSGDFIETYEQTAKCIIGEWEVEKKNEANIHFKFFAIINGEDVNNKMFSVEAYDSNGAVIEKVTGQWDIEEIGKIRASISGTSNEYSIKLSNCDRFVVRGRTIYKKISDDVKNDFVIPEPECIGCVQPAADTTY